VAGRKAQGEAVATGEMHGRLGAVAAQGGAAAVGEMRRRSEGGAGAAPTPRREGTRAWGRRGQRWEAGREMRSQASGVSSVSSARFFCLVSSQIASRW
jgi:hypothetical protein